jgi:SAM-dependent methyltransferase
MPTPSTTQRAFWDAVAPTKEFSHPLDLERLQARVPAPARILDYGCGYGRVCAQLQAAGYAGVCGVDLSPRMIERARAAHPDLAFDVLAGSKLPWSDGSIDAVLLFSVLTCIREDEGQRDVVEEIQRVLRPHGVIYVSDLLLQEDDRNRERYDEAQVRARFGGLQGRQPDRYGVFELEPGVAFRHLDRAWIHDVFAGFVERELVELSVTTMNGNAARGFQLFGRKPGVR